jgi:hypothetical protein
MLDHKGHTLLFLVQTYGRGPPNVPFANSITDERENDKRTLFFQKDPSLITRSMLHPFTQCTNSTGRMLGLGGRPLLSREVGSTLSYK